VGRGRGLPSAGHVATRTSHPPPTWPRARPARALLASPVLAQTFPALALRLSLWIFLFGPRRSILLVSRPLPGLRPTSVVARNSKIPSRYASFIPEQLRRCHGGAPRRAVRFPPVAVPISRHMLALPVHRRQFLKRCYWVCDGPEHVTGTTGPEPSHRELESSDIRCRTHLSVYYLE
jgi:hypothetical protein